MLGLKKSVLSILALCSSTAFAGTMGPVCSAENVTLPCTTGWEVSGSALYLQGSMETLTQLSRQISPASSIGYFDSNNPWAWGFMIDAGYHFGTGKDLDVNWYHYDYTQHNVLTDSATSSKPNWDAVNVEFGQIVDYGTVSHVRYYGGFEYVNLKLNRNLSTAGFVVDDPGVSIQRNSQYNGYGARAGAKGWYSMLDNLAFYADGALGLTTGSSTYRRRTTDFTTGQITGINVDSSVVVPQLEAKLGGMFGYPISRGILSLDAGWMWVNYFDPLIEVVSDDLNYYNASFQGPYVGLKWQGDLM